MRQSGCSLSRRFRLRSFFDDSIGFVLVTVGLTILAGMLVTMLLSSCVADKKKEAPYKSMAAESLLLMAEHPESVNIIGISTPDSVYGKNFFSNEELAGILDNITDFNSRTFGNNPLSVDLDNPRLAARMSRGAELTDLIRPLLSGDSGHSDFSGWKVKVLYDCTDEFNDTIRNERYFIFDKNMKYIIHSFEIPVL